MKALFICAVIILGTMMALAQGGQPASNQTTSIVRLTYDAAYYTAPDYTAAACERYKGMKTCGIVLTAIGGGLLATGVGIVVASHNGRIYSGAENRYFRGSTPLVAGGAASILIGSLSLTAGIPLATLGSTRQKRTCGQGRFKDY